MKPITIDGIEYTPEQLSEEARAHLAHLAYIETELQKMQMGINVLRVSRQKISELLRAALPGASAAAPAAPAAQVAAPAAAPAAAKTPAKSGKSGRK